MILLLIFICLLVYLCVLCFTLSVWMCVGIIVNWFGVVCQQILTPNSVPIWSCLGNKTTSLLCGLATLRDPWIHECIYVQCILHVAHII